MQRGGLGQGCVCRMPQGFSTLGPMPDLAVTAPRCADCYRPRASTKFIPLLPSSGQQASTRACSSRPTRPTGTALAAGSSPYTPPAPLPPPPLMSLASPAPCPVPAGGTPTSATCRTLSVPTTPARVCTAVTIRTLLPHPCVATSIPTLASGGYRGHRFCTVTTPFTPPHPHRPHFHGHHRLHLSHCHGVDNYRPCNRHENMAPEVTAAGQHGA